MMPAYARKLSSIRNTFDVRPMRSRAFPAATLILSALSASQSFAASTIVRDGGTIQLADVTYRLDGIDAPEFDQMCIDEHADTWACGVEARDQLSGLIGSRQVRCEDLGLGTTYKKRHIGICTVEGESASLNQLLVRQGFALNFEPYARGRFREDEAGAKDNRRGLWKGCFVAPQEFRWGRKDGALLGESCRTDKDREIRAVLFPDEPAMPPGCSIKGKFAVRARLTGNVGVYHVQGCRSYRTAGFVPRKMPRPAGSGRRIIAGQPTGDGCNNSVARVHSRRYRCRQTALDKATAPYPPDRRCQAVFLNWCEAEDRCTTSIHLPVELCDQAC
jgi:endonuclease YncB( thermonuclease family)